MSDDYPCDYPGKEYFATLEEKPQTVVELLALWKKRYDLWIPGPPEGGRWQYAELKHCIKELEALHERNLFD